MYHSRRSFAACEVAADYLPAYEAEARALEAAGDAAGAARARGLKPLNNAPPARRAHMRSSGH